MPDRTQIGPMVNTDLWERFRRNIKERKGVVRGNVGTELENAIRQYLNDDTDPDLRRANNKLNQIVNALDIADADGGVDTPEPSLHTHAPAETTVDEKPAANAATDKKVAYLAGCVIEQEVPNSRELVSIPRSNLIDVVKSEYGFRSDTAKRYVERLVEEFDLLDHPDADGILVTVKKHEELLEQQREKAKQEVNKKL